MLIYIFMVFQAVRRIISGTHYLDIELFHKFLSAVFLRLQLLRTLIINGTCSRRIQKVIDTEHTGKLKMRPVIERVTHSIRHCFRPFFKFFIAAAPSGYIFLRNTVASHRAPLVMVAPEPYFSQIPELMVVCDHLGDKMAVIVYNRHFLRTPVIKFTGIVIGQHKVIIDELPVPHHIQIFFDFIQNIHNQLFG